MLRNSGETRFGVLYSVVASSLFALLYYYVSWLAPLDGLQIYGWRVLLTMPLVLAFVLASGRGIELLRIARRLRKEWRLWLIIPLSSLLLGVQLWLFMWAPLNGVALAVSLGYFLLPLALVLAGRVVFRERISTVQAVACCIALIGVINESWMMKGVSWPTVAVVAGYTCYFSLRRFVRLDNLGGMCFDMLLSLPVALYCTQGGAAAAGFNPMLALLVLGLGLISATALACMVVASQKLSLGLFGLLSYLEPALLVLVSLLLGERIAPAQWLTYAAIWSAILLLLGEGVFKLRRVAGRVR